MLYAAADPATRRATVEDMAAPHGAWNKDPWGSPAQVGPCQTDQPSDR